MTNWQRMHGFFLIVGLVVFLALATMSAHAGPANVISNYNPSTSNITASWSVLAGASWYQWCFGADNWCGSPLDSGVTANGSVTSLSWTRTLAQGRYYFVIEACVPPTCLTNDTTVVTVVYDITAPTCAVSALSAYQNYSTFTVTWNGTDALSAIATYTVQVSDNAGPWTAWAAGAASNTAVFTGTDLHNYAFRCIATDNAGNQGTYPGTANTNTTVDAVVGTTITGLVDGSAGADLSYQQTNASLSAHWNEVITDTLHQYAIGATPGGTDVAGWTSLWNGGSPINDSKFTVTGLSLSDGTTYYFSIRVVSTTGRQGTVYTTDGVMVDTTPPSCDIAVNTQCISPYSAGTWNISWNSSDNIALSSNEVQIQDNSGGWTAWVQTGNAYAPNPELLAGHVYDLRCRGIDNAGNAGAWSTTKTLTVDTTPPVISYVYDGTGADVAYTNSSVLSANWSASDACAGIRYNYFAAGTTPGGGDLRGFANWPAGTPVNFDFNGWGLVSGQTYYITVKEEDWLGNSSQLSSNGIIYDTQPPTPQFTAPTTDYSGSTSFNISWTASDGANGSGNKDNYTIQYRDNGGAWQDWGSQPTTSTFDTFTGADTHTYDFRIIAQDNAGNWSSYPVTPDYNLRVSIYTTRPDAPAAVYDGVTSGADVDIRATNSGLAAYWDPVTLATGGPPVYAYAIGTTSGGTEILNWTETSGTSFDYSTATYGDGTYYVSVKTRNVAGVWSLNPTTSDGIMIDTAAPSCAVTALDPWQVLSSSFSVAWSGSDATAGIANYDVEYQDNAGGWTSLVTGSAGLSSTFNGANGHAYQFRCRATDNAGNSSAMPGSAQTTTSVDTSVPSISYVYDGAGADESNASSATTISANWAGSDAESGIQKYEYAVGTTSGGTNILGWTNAALSVSVTNSSLSLANAARHYVTVRAYNNAGLVSEVTSNGILTDLAAPTATITQPTSAYTATENFTVSWSGSDGAGESGLKNYQVQYKDGTGAWTDWAPMPTADVTRTFNGANGHTYYFRVRAEDNTGNVGSYPASPDYQAVTTVDTTLLPAPATISDGGVSGSDVDYTTNTSSLSGWWAAVPDAAGYVYFAGTAAGGSNVIARTSTTGASFTASSLSLTDGARYYISVEAINNSGTPGTTGTSDGIMVDTTAPTCAVASLSAWQSAAAAFTVQWSGADASSGIVNYDVQVQDNGGGWTNWKTAETGTSGMYSGTGGHTYEFKCRATDNTGNSGSLPASAQASTQIDTTAPSLGSVYDGTGADESMTTSGSALSANWTGSDAESGIQRYEYAIGTTPGGSDVAAWTINGVSAAVTRTGLSLQNAVKHYVSVRAYNNSGLYTQATSDGILVDTQPPTAQLTSPTSSSVGTLTFDVEWTGSDGAGESGLKDYTVQYKIEGGEWTDWASSPTTAVTYPYTGPDGQIVYFRIKARDNAGNVGSYPVNPDYQLKTQIDITRPSAPAHVYDGESGDDLDYTTTSTTLSGHWDAVAGAAGYAYAIGTIAGEPDVVTWTDVTANSFTKTGLSLTGGKKYYLAVRMKNAAGSWSGAAVSDGIIVDTTAPGAPGVKDDGDITSESSTLHFTVSASDGETGVAKIEYAIGTAADKTDVRGWTSMGVQTSLTVSGLSLSPGARYFVLARAENAAGLVSNIGASDGINRVVGASISFSYLPLELSVAAGNQSDVLAPIEMIIKENGGSKVIFTQLKASYSLPGGTTVEDPVKSTSLTVQANEEQRLKTSVSIPARIVTLAMGGVTRAEVNVKLNYIGTDSGGNAVSTVFNIPVKLTSSDSEVQFMIGSVKITSPEAGQYVGGAAAVSAAVSVTGVGTIKGQWVLNGKSAGGFTRDVEKSGEITISAELTPLMEGGNSVLLRITSPEYRETAALKFKGTAASAKKLTELWVGDANITDIKATYDPTTRTYTGSGKLKLPFSDTAVEVPLKKVSVTQQGSKTVITGAVTADITGYSAQKGQVVAQVTTLMLSATGISADGTITLRGANGAPGVGPLYFYGVAITDAGMEGKVKLDSPQKGKLGAFVLTMDGMTFKVTPSGADVKATGALSMSKGKITLNKSIVMETTSSGGVRIGKPR